MFVREFKRKFTWKKLPWPYRGFYLVKNTKKNAIRFTLRSGLFFIMVLLPLLWCLSLISNFVMVDVPRLVPEKFGNWPEEGPVFFVCLFGIATVVLLFSFRIYIHEEACSVSCTVVFFSGSSWMFPWKLPSLPWKLKLPQLPPRGSFLHVEASSVEVVEASMNSPPRSHLPPADFVSARRPLRTPSTRKVAYQSTRHCIAS